MNIDRIHHLNIRCAPDDLAAIEKFYAEVLGLQRGHRPPNLRNRGIWLYLGDAPIIHVTARCAEGYVQGEHRGSIDHVAFQSSGAAGFLVRLAKLNIPYEQQNVEGAGYQVFVRDPVGTTLEFNFPNSEAPEAMASGTLAPRQTLGAG
jgi:catechol 2,3-dioxygenase-like lactoylglutathione lyase family enzyme